MTTMSGLQARAGDSVLDGVDPLAFEVTNPIRLFIIQAAIIIIICRILGYGLGKIRQPKVIAEVIGGILLGPTVMGRIPGFTNQVFPSASLSYLNLVATLGLVLFLFIVGLEVDLRTVKKTWKTSCTVSLLGLIVPFGLGAGVSKGIYDSFIDPTAVGYNHFLLFAGVAMSITAFPVLARILTETKLLYTKVGVITLAAGVGNDVVGWILLALTVALVNAGSGVIAVYALLCAVGWTLVLFFAIKPAFIWLARRTGSFENGPTQLMITLTLLLVLISAWITDIIGVHPIFGAFLVGLMVPHEGGYAIAMTEKLEDLVTVIFLPIYFALSGLRTNLGTLNGGLVWGYTVAIIAIAFFSKFLSCAGAAKLTGFNWRESAAIGTLMSCKGLVELIVLNIGLQAGVLNTQTFSMFVLMAVISTVITTPLVLWIYPEKHRTMMEDADTATQHHHTSKKLGHDESHEGEPGLACLHASSKRLLVVLTGFENLPSLMSLLQLIRPNLALATATSAQREATKTPGQLDEKAAHSSSPSDSSHEVSFSESLPMQPNQSTASACAPLSIDALRLVPLTDRTSAVMRVAENEDTLRADPISNLFKTVAQMNRIPVKSSMTVVPTEQFSNVIVDRAKVCASDFVVLPWTIPGGLTRQAVDQEASPASLTNPFAGLFGGAANAVAPTDAQAVTRNTHQYTALARKLIRDATCDVGLLVDRGEFLAASSTMPADVGVVQANHVLLGFMGGPDDQVALKLVSRLVAVATNLQLTVLQFKRSAAVIDTVQSSLLGGHQRSVTQNTQLTVQETQYNNPIAPMQAALQDDLAVEAIQNDTTLQGRVTVKTITTAHPVRDLILAVETERPSLVIVGRGRRNPTLGSHRDELRSLLVHGTSPRRETVSSPNPQPAADPESAVPASPTSATSPQNDSTRLVNGETCKVVGEVAMGLAMVSKLASGSSLLVVAAGNEVTEEGAQGDA